MNTVKNQGKFLFILTIILFFSIVASREPFYSVELGLAEPSPSGEKGGFVVPASCSSYVHTTGACGSPSFSIDAEYGGGASATISIGEDLSFSWACPPGSTDSAGVGFSSGGALTGTVSVSPTETTEYSIQCEPEGAQSAITVTIASPTLNISVSPARVRSGNTSVVSWSASSVTSCTLVGTGISTSCSGTACANAHTNTTGALTAQSIYTLACSVPSGDQTATATVFMTPSVCEVGTVGCPE